MPCMALCLAPAPVASSVLPAALSTASPDISTLRKRMTGMLELTARLCCSRLPASCAEMARCAGRSLKALARVGACSSLMSRGVDAALRNATCRRPRPGNSLVYVLQTVCVLCTCDEVCSRHSCCWLQRSRQPQPTHLYCDPALGGTLQVQDAVALSLAADGSGAPDCGATAG